MVLTTRTSLWPKTNFPQNKSMEAKSVFGNKGNTRQRAPRYYFLPSIYLHATYFLLISQTKRTQQRMVSTVVWKQKCHSKRPESQKTDIFCRTSSDNARFHTFDISKAICHKYWRDPEIYFTWNGNIFGIERKSFWYSQSCIDFESILFISPAQVELKICTITP